MIVDTPGLREVQILASEECLDGMMTGVLELAAQCKFRNCTHSTEPGCQVQLALTQEDLAPEEFSTYTGLQRQLSFNRRKLDQRLASEERKRWKRITIDMRRRNRMEF
jgi:ribosome biogenesis GTPase